MMYPGLAENQWYGQPKKVDLVTHLKYQGAIDSRKCQTSVGKGGKLVVGRFDDLLSMSRNHAGIKGSSNDVEEAFLIFHTDTHGIIITAKECK